MTPALLTQEEAATYLAVSPRWLEDAPIPWVDMRKPGAGRAVRRWRVSDLDAVVAERIVQPGDASRW